MDKINLRRVYKDCLISCGGNQYSVPSGYVERDAAAVALDNMLAVYHEGKQIALHRISHEKKDMVVNDNHYQRLAVKQSVDANNTLLDNGNVIDFPVKPHDLKQYDEAVYG